MAALFVSHSSRDGRRGTDLCAAAGRRVRRAVCRLRPEQGIPAGRNWERELYAQLRRTDAVIFLASAAAVASLTAPPAAAGTIRPAARGSHRVKTKLIRVLEATRKGPTNVAPSARLDDGLKR